MAQTSAVVFEDKGNRFIVPALWWNDDERPAGWILEAMGFATCVGVNYERELIPIDDNRPLPHVKASMGSSMLAHGSTSVLIIAGPLFDAVAVERS